MKKRVLVVGNTNMNLNMHIATLPGPGQTAANRQFDYLAGGNGTCVTVALNKLGCDTVYSTRLGQDLNGQRLLSFFSDIGVDTRFIKSDKTLKTGFEVCIIESNGISRRILYKGANEAHNSKDIEEAFTCYPDAVYARADMQSSLIVAASYYSSNDNSKFFLNVCGAKSDFPFAELDSVDIVIANESSIYDITGIYPQDVERCLKACIALSSRIKATHYVLKNHGRGTFIYDGKYYHIIAPYENASASVDASAADEAYDAALISEYLNSGDIKSAVEYAHIVYYLTSMEEGLYISIPNEQTVNEFIEKKGLMQKQ